MNSNKNVRKNTCTHVYKHQVKSVPLNMRINIWWSVPFCLLNSQDRSKEEEEEKNFFMNLPIQNEREYKFINP